MASASRTTGTTRPLLGADRDADVVVVLVDDVVAVDLGVDLREFLQRDDRRLDEERHEAEPHAVLLLEAPPPALAQRHHRRHVDLVERRQHRRVLLRLHQALGDAAAQPGHAHAGFALGRFAAGRSAGGRRPGAGAGVSRLVGRRRLGRTAPAGRPRAHPLSSAVRRGRSGSARRHRPRFRRRTCARPGRIGRASLCFSPSSRARGGSGRRLPLPLPACGERDRRARGWWARAEAAPSAIVAEHRADRHIAAFGSLDSPITPACGAGTSSVTLSVPARRPARRVRPARPAASAISRRSPR